MYVSSNPPGTKNPMVANIMKPSLTEVWDPIPVAGGVALLSEDNGDFASASGPDGMLYVNRGSVSQWETYKIVDAPNGYHTIMSLRNNMHINVTQSGNLTPTSSTQCDSCLFTLEVPNGGSIR